MPAKRKAGRARTGNGKKKPQRRQAEKRLALVNNSRLANATTQISNMDACLLTLAKIRANPWAMERNNICNTAGESGQYVYTPSYARGSFAAGTGGFACIALNPYWATIDVPTIYATNATYAISANFDTTIPGVDFIQPAGPFSASGVKAMKIVAVGLRVWNLNPALTTRGQILAFRIPENELLQQANVTDVFQTRYNVVEPIVPAGSWVTGYHTVGTPLDNNFNSHSAVILAHPKSFNLGFMIIGANPGDGFGYEVLYHTMVLTGNTYGTTFAIHDVRADTLVSKITEYAQNIGTTVWTSVGPRLESLAINAAIGLMRPTPLQAIKFRGRVEEL